MFWDIRNSAGLWSFILGRITSKHRHSNLIPIQIGLLFISKCLSHRQIQAFVVLCSPKKRVWTMCYPHNYSYLNSHESLWIFKWIWILIKKTCIIKRKHTFSVICSKNKQMNNSISDFQTLYSGPGCSVFCCLKEVI